jgi:hypothetical protein
MHSETEFLFWEKIVPLWLIVKIWVKGYKIKAIHVQYFPNEEFVKFWKWIDWKEIIGNLMVKSGKGGGENLKRICIIVGFIDAISTYHDKRYEFESRPGNTILCDKVYQWLVVGPWFSLCTPFSSTNKTDRHDITGIVFICMY